MFNEIDTTYLAAIGILSPIAIFASGLLAMLATLGFVGVWFLRTFVDCWTDTRF